MDRANSHEALDLERCHKGSNMFGASSDPRAVDVLVRGDPNNLVALAREVVDKRAELRDAKDSPRLPCQVLPALEWRPIRRRGSAFL